MEAIGRERLDDIGHSGEMHPRSRGEPDGRGQLGPSHRRRWRLHAIHRRNPDAERRNAASVAGSAVEYGFAVDYGYAAGGGCVDGVGWELEG